MFGALAATPTGSVHGFGAPLESLTFGLLVFPIVWDWYIHILGFARRIYASFSSAQETVSRVQSAV